MQARWFRPRLAPLLEGRVTLVLGPSGMGKSTLIRTILGHVQQRDGHISLFGQDVSRARPHECARLGVAYVPEGRGVFPNLTVRENLLLGAHVQVAQGARDAAERDQALAGALAGVERATHVAEQLLTLARLEQGAWKEAAEPFDLRRLAAECVADRAGTAASRRIALALEGSESATARGHAGLVAIAVSASLHGLAH